MIVLRLDKADGPVIGRVMISPTGSLDNYSEFTCKVKEAKGVHDLYLCFSGNGDDLFNLDSWSFKK